MAKVLVVDDETMTVDLLSMYLNLIGHEPLSAQSGQEIWERLAEGQPDAILLDLMLPDMDGLSICRELRAQAGTRSIPVIVISAYSPPQHEAARAAGATAYLSKPIPFDQLRQLLDQQWATVG